MQRVSKLTLLKTASYRLGQTTTLEVHAPKSSQSPRRFRQILITYLRRVKGGLGLAALSMLGYTLMELLSPWPLKIIFDYILLDHPLPEFLSFLEPIFHNGQAPALSFSLDPNLPYLLSVNFQNWKTLLLPVMVGCIALIAILSSSFSYFQIYLTSRIGYQLVYTLRTELFSHLQRLSLSFHQRARRGELLTKIASDTNILKEVFTESLLELLTNFLTLIGMFIVMFWVNWQLSLIVLLTFPALLIIFIHLQQKLKDSVRQQRKKEGKIASQLNDILSAIMVVQAFGREGYEATRFKQANAENLTEGIQIARLDAAVTRSVTIISAIGLSMVILVGAWQSLTGSMSPGEVLVFVAYVKSIYKPVRDLVKLSTKLSKAMVSAQRIAELLDVEPEIQDARHVTIAGKLRGEIVFKNVSFRYEEDQTILRNISFTIAPGQRVALVGASGAGKSSIASLILRLYDPQQGVIMIDGVNLKDYQRQSLRRQIGLVLQDSTLFGATIRENIAYGKPEATLAEIEMAARQAQAHDFITALPEGYDTVVGEMGCTLSGGQRQRIAIARALIKQPSILILDEPTSALDAESEAQVQEALNCLQQDKTTLVIAHHLAAIKDFDQILVLKNGEIVERGTHPELLNLKGYYYELYQLQDAAN